MVRLLVVLLLLIAIPTQSIQFNVLENGTRELYSRFIEQIRAAVQWNTAFNIPVLRPAETVLQPAQRYILVDLYHGADEHIGVILDVVDMYVRGFLAGGQYFCFSDSPDSFNIVFPGAISVGFGSSYGAIESAARQERMNLDLGLEPLGRAISQLRYRNSEPAVARSLLVIICMISEAVRFTYVESQIGVAIDNGANWRPDYMFMGMVNSWGQLSYGVQGAENGIFPWPVQVLNNENVLHPVETVNSAVVALLGILLYQRRQCLHEEQSCPSMIGRHIIGLDGKCLDHLFVHLWMAQCSQNPNQLWLINQTGLIQGGGVITSLGKCLTARANLSSSSPFVTVEDCMTNDRRQQWLVTHGRTIEQMYSGEALTADRSGYLEVSAGKFVPNQIWKIGNDVQPFWTKIKGFKGYCLEGYAANISLKMAPCDESNKEQLWGLYPDNSIRPYNYKDYCIARFGEGATSLYTLACLLHMDDMGWFFRPDGSISFRDTRAVMQVDVNGTMDIILGIFTGDFSQKFFVEF